MAKKKVQHHIFGPVEEVEVDLLGNVIETTPVNAPPVVVEVKPVVVVEPVEVPELDEYHKENP